MDAAIVREAKLVKGFHLNFREERVIIIEHPNGWKQEIYYDDDQVATPALIEAMIDSEMGVRNPETRLALHSYCINFVQGWTDMVGYPEINGIRVGNLRTIAWGFVDGYEYIKSPSTCLTIV